MKVVIFRVQLSHLRNSEYTMLVSQLVAVFLKFNAEFLHLKKSFDRVLAMLPSLEKVKAQEKSSAYSNLIHELDVQRSKIIKAFGNQVKNLEKSGLNSLDPHLIIVNRLLDKHGRDIASVDINSKTKKLIDLLNDINTTPEIIAAINALSLTIFVDQLRAVNTEFDSKYMLRTEKDSSLEVVDAPAIRAEMDKVLNDFFDAIEFCSKEYDELDYSTPAKELNEHILHYKTKLKARDTRRENGKDTSTEDPITPKE